MKTFIISFKNLNPLLLIGFVFLLLTACGTHKKDYDEVDGIYSSTQNNEVADEITGEEDKNNYYKHYFKTKQSAYKDVPEDNAILTDVEAYYTSETLDEEGYVVSEEQEYSSEYNEGNGAWGSNSTQVSINVYGGMGYAPYYAGWGNPYYGVWGNPYYGGWGNPYYGYGWGNPYYGGGEILICGGEILIMDMAVIMVAAMVMHIIEEEEIQTI